MNGNNLPIDVYREPNEDQVIQEVEKIITMAGMLCRVLGIDPKKFKINISALKDIVIRIDERKLYFYIYHNRMKPNECKMLSLFIYWTLKLRPFWFLEDKDDSDFASTVNEKFCAYVFIQVLQIIKPQKCLTVAKSGFLTELVYSFRYRDLSKESLYLVFDACVSD